MTPPPPPSTEPFPPVSNEAELILEIVPPSDGNRRARLLALLLRSSRGLTLPQLEGIAQEDRVLRVDLLESDLRALHVEGRVSRRRSKGPAAWWPSLRVRRAYRPGRLA